MLFLLSFTPLATLFLEEAAAQSAPAVSKTAAASCAAKIKKLEEFSRRPASGKTEPTRFTEDEINSYLALNLRPKFNPSLKNLVIRLEEGRLQGNALIDFDRLEMKSSEMAARLFSYMVSGVHELMVRGDIPVNDGKGYFQLEEAQFDGTRLPAALVKEIITLIGRRQKPPFDPLIPTDMIYDIQKIDLHQKYLIVYQ